MRRRNQSKEIGVKGKEVFVGIDVHKEAGRSQFDGGGGDDLPH